MPELAEARQRAAPGVGPLGLVSESYPGVRLWLSSGRLFGPEEGGGRIHCLSRGFRPCRGLWRAQVRVLPLLLLRPEHEVPKARGQRGGCGSALVSSSTFQASGLVPLPRTALAARARVPRGRCCSGGPAACSEPPAPARRGLARLLRRLSFLKQVKRDRSALLITSKACDREPLSVRAGPRAARPAAGDRGRPKPGGRMEAGPAGEAASWGPIRAPRALEQGRPGRQVHKVPLPPSCGSFSLPGRLCPSNLPLASIPFPWQQIEELNI